MRKLLAALPAGLVLLAVAAPAAPAPRGEDDTAELRIEIEGDDGETVRIETGGGWLAALIGAVDVECDSDADPETRRMMRALRAHGPGGVYRYRDEREGEDVVGRRTATSLELKTNSDDGDHAVIEMPWEAAECLMLGIEPSGDLGRRLARGDAKLRIDVRDGDGRVRIALE